LGCQEHGQCISACRISVCKAESYFSITQGNSGRSQKSAVFCSNTDQAYTSHGQPFQPGTAISVYYHQLFFHTCKHHGSCTLVGDSHATLLLNVQLVDKVCKIELISTFQATPLAAHCKAEPGQLAQHSLLPIDSQNGQVAAIQRACCPVTMGILVLTAPLPTQLKMACFGPSKLTTTHTPPLEALQTSAHTPSHTSSRWFSLPHAMPSATLAMCTSPH
jgi:hypothetical protein